jgi:hypothetical protein
MMKMRISTPHYMEQTKGKASPFGFVLHPRLREELELTLLTPLSKDRANWASSECINTRDGKGYRLNALREHTSLRSVTFCVAISCIPKSSRLGRTARNANSILEDCYE